MKYNRLFLKTKIELDSYIIDKSEKKELLNDVINKYKTCIIEGKNGKDAYEISVLFLNTNLKKYEKIKKNKYRFSFIFLSYILFASFIVSLTSRGYENILNFSKYYFIFMLILIIALLIYISLSIKNRSIFNFLIIIMILLNFIILNFISFEYFYTPSHGRFEYYLCRDFFGKLTYLVYDKNENSEPVRRNYFYDPTLLLSLLGFLSSYILMNREERKNKK